MPAALTLPPAPIPLRLPASWRLTDDALLQLNALREGWFFEADAEGALLIAPGSPLRTSARGAQIIGQLVPWSDAEIGGAVIGAPVLLRLPDGSRLMPRIAWISDARLAQIPPEEAERITPTAPDFVVDIRPPKGDLNYLRGKMAMWLANGVRLGWLIDPYEAKVHIYRPNTEPELLERPSELGDAEVLPGLSVVLERVWA